MAKNGNDNGSRITKCEKCKKIIDGLVFERGNKLVCRKCANAIDGREVDDSEDDS
jgi:hypothetical protein